MQPETQRITPLRQRLVVGALMFLLLLLLGITSARAGEIVPSVGLSHSSESGENQSFFGLEVRGSLAPMLKAGLGVGYRSEEMSNGDLTMRIIPVTASLWVSPVPTLYAGGGVGAYFETLTYRDALLVPN
jgi:hypothetical protein